MSDPSLSAKLQQLLDKQDITDVLFRYCRGVDRSDRAALESVYWPDAPDDHMLYQGSGKALIDYLHTAVKEMRTQHRVTNILIEFDSESKARCESYVWAYHNMDIGNGARDDVIFGGRYLDHFEKRLGVWRISARKLVMDYFQHLPGSVDLGVFGALPITGVDYPADPLYAMKQ